MTWKYTTVIGAALVALVAVGHAWQDEPQTGSSEPVVLTQANTPVRTVDPTTLAGFSGALALTSEPGPVATAVPVRAEPVSPPEAMMLVAASDPVAPVGIGPQLALP